MKISEILHKAANLIEPPGKWVQRLWAGDIDGNLVDPCSYNAVCWCMAGAVHRVTAGDWPVRKIAIGAVRAELPADGTISAFGVALGGDIPRFNDDPNTTQEMAVAKLRDVAAKYEALGQ